MDISAVRPAVVKLAKQITDNRNRRYVDVDLATFVDEQSLILWKASHGYTSDRGIHGRLASDAEELQVTVAEMREQQRDLLTQELTAVVYDIAVVRGKRVRYTPILGELLSEMLVRV